MNVLLDQLIQKKYDECEICKLKYRLLSDSYNNYINTYIDNFIVINFDIDTTSNDRNIYNNLINTENTEK